MVKTKRLPLGDMLRTNKENERLAENAQYEKDRDDMRKKALAALDVVIGNGVKELKAQFKKMAKSKKQIEIEVCVTSSGLGEGTWLAGVEPEQISALSSFKAFAAACKNENVGVEWRFESKKAHEEDVGGYQEFRMGVDFSSSYRILDRSYL